ncbi:hypothetical protein PLESTB_000127200 [Pleodorina starrii]|uniref:Uncharacterized protein n=1 Tax=Pleodorina starrii TaxID=330485 RepID=A0A9W6BBF9_9CHLO|nr:hypothetical protein PLESTM_000486300 [Pleodorina starrii]GLC48700.1 hypothetical protein PLESTB_000127200 [Pleodorina starrii]GLC74251.1 hypothetical protein PLESTF_001481100 [Pleodorina starrii]
MGEGGKKKRAQALWDVEGTGTGAGWRPRRGAVSPPAAANVATHIQVPALHPAGVPFRARWRGAGRWGGRAAAAQPHPVCGRGPGAERCLGPGSSGGGGGGGGGQCQGPGLRPEGPGDVGASSLHASGLRRLAPYGNFRRGCR